ncbi:hypothetical protein N7533_010610 [Penicillium manginii]|uniref:uncharacterized protein n=1 Tax=Penicillium manginii TaxID=203109 RepID=UPI002549B9F3|nr:uncharacterized protein N7533_010610 [Penicillium manginii]KAJ5743508.1 hypothetical protein N7533_010610 [Penicillium manginii]
MDLDQEEDFGARNVTLTAKPTAQTVAPEHEAPQNPAIAAGVPSSTCIGHTILRIYRCTPTPTIVLDGSLQVVEVSESYEALSNAPRDQIINISVYALTPRVILAPNIASLSRALGMAITTRAVQVIDNLRVGQNEVDTALRITPIFDGDDMIYVLMEVQKAKREMAGLNVMGEQVYPNELYRIIVDAVKDYAIFMLDTQGHITTWNSGAATLKGYTAEEIIGQHFSIFYGREDCKKNKPARELEICLQEGKVEDEGWRYRKNGTRFWANVMITATHQYGRHVGFVKVTRDMTGHKAAEAHLIDAFEESSNLKSRFLANVSHELRTPMNGMSLALAMLMDTPLNDNQREYASMIEGSVKFFMQVINNLLDYSQMSSDPLLLHTDIFSIPNEVSMVTRKCKSGTKPGVALGCTVAPQFPQNVKGDRLRFRQVLQNLVSNAVKFTERGYVRVDVTYTVDEDDPETYIITARVVDSGVGVPHDTINSLFEPLTQFAGSATKSFPATRLEFSICKTLAELMNGTVGFHANPDGPGNVFWMAVKMGRVDTSNFQATQSRSWEDETPLDTSALLQVVAPQTHILLVEDNKINHTIMLKLLNSLGFEQLDAAWDGTEAVRMVKSKPLAYNLILMDINMPVMDGLTATEHIRKMNAAVPIIALTGNALKGDAETYLARGMSDSVAKPLHRQQLANVLWKWCGTQFSDYLPPESSSPVQSLGGYRQDHAGVETDRPRRKSRSLTYWPVRPVG